VQNIKLFFSNFINPDYLFEKTPPFPFQFLLPLLIFFGLMFLVGLVAPWVLKKRFRKSPPFEKLAGKIQTPLITFSLLGFSLLFFRWQAIPYLSARVLLLILISVFLFWLISFSFYLKRGFQKELFQYQEELRKLKYLPSKKKRGYYED
jgi:hypothetical protein